MNAWRSLTRPGAAMAPLPAAMVERSRSRRSRDLVPVELRPENHPGLPFAAPVDGDRDETTATPSPSRDEHLQDVTT